ncbi:MAG: HEAT repeat domain-containing protein [Bryobacteraceae bacterium]
MRVLVMVVTAASAIAQQVPVTNAKLETQALSGSLAAALRSAGSGSGPRWVGYVVPAVEGAGSSCCWDSRYGQGCHLEPVTRPGTVGGRQTVQLEGEQYTTVLFRYENGQLSKLRGFSGDCNLDAGGLTFVVLTGVRASESAEMLAGYVTPQAFQARPTDKIAEGAMQALARHRDPVADRALERFVEPSQPENLRSKVVFWLGSTRGKRGLEMLNRLAAQDPSDRVREQVAFGYSTSREPDAMTALINMAKSDRSPRVRGQALFWMAQKAGDKVASMITDAIRDDPETEVKKKAVFALSQLPADQGVPRLIDVARTNRNPEVRKQAMFWLGQSKDKRAVDFFEAVLTK